MRDEKMEWSDPLYVALARMEHDGRVRSEWVNDPCPGRRNGPLVATSSRTVSAAHVRDIRERATFPRASVGSPAVRRISTFGDNFAAAGISSHSAWLDGRTFAASFVFVYCLFAASLANRRARRRAVLVRTASFSASYSCIASTASRARSSFAVIAARCLAFFKIVAMRNSSVYGCISPPALVPVFAPP
jgi:hypothetical protein